MTRTLYPNYNRNFKKC